MLIPDLSLGLRRLHAPLPIWHALVHAGDWSAAADAVRNGGGRLVSVWGSAADALAVHAAYAVQDGLAWLELPLDAVQPVYPDLAGVFPAAGRMQRAVADLLGLQAEGALDQRPWLDHGAWDAAWPLRHEPGRPDPARQAAAAGYGFVQVQGDGVHEIPVGPVHAGIIEPGHFRFSVVGEKVLRLEQRLGYTHKGVARRFTEIEPLQAHRLAGRLSGDSTVAGAWAYCMALESAAQCEVPARAASLRALLLERERVANHLGDLGALGNDAAFAFGQAQFSRLREDWLRLSQDIFGHRLTMDLVCPGGVSRDIEPAACARIARQCDVIAHEVHLLRTVYEEHAGLQDRFLGTGRVAPPLAAQLGLTGLAGRASGQAWDLRSDHAWTPYDRFEVQMATHRNGDVAARVTVRFDELLESLRLIRAILAGLPGGDVASAVALPNGPAIGAGWVEGWRGEVLIVLQLGAGLSGASIRYCHSHDPSWHNWPVLEHAVIGNIVPDFPLINKSFNLSYSGHDS